MNLRSISTLILGLGLASGATYLANTLTKTNLGAADATQVETIEVVVAKSEIAFGQAIEAHMLGTQTWPAELIPNDIYVDISRVLPTNGQEPRRALGRIYPGELLLNKKVSDFGGRVTLVQKLRDGYRAMAIKVDATTAVGGFVTPGDVVDIVMTQGTQQNMRAATVLQNIRVVGVDQTSEEDSNQPSVARTITVEVSPAQAQRLALAQKAGTLSLSLCTLDEKDLAPVAQIDIQDLFATPKPESETAEETVSIDTRPRITIRRGASALEEVVLK